MSQHPSGWRVRVPATSANLGAGFDVLGMALTLYAEVGCGEPPHGAHTVDAHHPAFIAFRRLGGTGPLWVASPIPMGRGMGYSGAVRVGGAAAAIAQRDGSLDTPGALGRVLEVTAELERHADNVAPSIFGGIVITVDGMVTRVPISFEPAIVMWVPDATSTSTEHSRAALPAQVDRADAIFNLGRVAMFVAACASGDTAALRPATDDRLHQPIRLQRVPESREAIAAALDAGAWASWLSGSGPTVAIMCDPREVGVVTAALPTAGHSKVMSIDATGTVLLPDGG